MDTKSTPIRSLRRSKSMCSLQSRDTDLPFSEELRFSRSVSQSSIEVYVVNDTASDGYYGDEDDDGRKDSGIDDEVFSMLERKIDRLDDLLLVQCELLKDLKEEINCHSKESDAMSEDSTDTAPAQNKCVVDILKKALTETCLKLQDQAFSLDLDDDCRFSSAARSLLDALQSRPASLNENIRDAILQFLQSDEVIEQVVSSTTTCIRELVRQRFTRDVSALYLPVLERSQRRLGRHITRVLECAFAELEESTASTSTSIFNTCRSLRRALDSRCINRATAFRVDQFKKDFKQILQSELELWRSKALEALCPPSEADLEEEPVTPPPDYCPSSPPQPADPQASVTDQLMMTALINKKISDGDIAGAFESALSAGDLSLVMAACRGADPGIVAYLPRNVLLSLAQQLATDMVHETQLKCRYLEEALISLDQSDQANRAHLPLVVREIRKHLSDFLSKYPGHVASRRITLITMAAYNLLA